jgi:hypothetical protein
MYSHGWCFLLVGVLTNPFPFSLFPFFPWLVFSPTILLLVGVFTNHLLLVGVFTNQLRSVSHFPLCFLRRMGMESPQGRRPGMHGAAELTAGRYRCNDAARA